MAFPTVVGVSHGTDVEPDATSMTVALPDGCSVGRTLLVHVVKDGTGTVTWPSGWTILDEAQQDTSSSYESTRWRVIDGTEGFDGTGDTITVSGDSESWLAYSWLLSNAGTPTCTAGNGNGTACDPPAHTPAGGSDDYLWIVLAGWNGNPGAVTAYPTGYDDNQHSDATGGTGNVKHARCSKFATGSTDNPGAFSVSAGTWRALTIAIPGVATPPPSDDFGPIYGISANVYQMGPESESNFQADLTALRNTGAGWVRVDINWAVIQDGGPSSYNWTDYDRCINAFLDEGLSVLGCITYAPGWARSGSDYPPDDPADFATFCTTAVTRYAAMGVHHYEVWNEPNLSNFWAPAANVAAYTDLLQAAYTAIKAADASAFVLTGGMSPAVDGGNDIDPRTFLDGIYTNGGGNYFDAVGHHPYCNPADPGEVQTWSAWSQMYTGANNLRGTMTDNGDSDKRIWMTEFGAPDDSYSEAQIAEWVTTAYTLVSGYDWAGPLFWYSLRDLGTLSAGDYYGLVNYDWTEKPSFAAYQDLTGYVPDTFALTAVSAGTLTNTASSGAAALTNATTSGDPALTNAATTGASALTLTPVSGGTLTL